MKQTECRNGIYTVKTFDFLEKVTEDTLYAATLPMPDAYTEKLEKHIKTDKSLWQPISVFTLMESGEAEKNTVGRDFWIPRIERNRLTGFYFVTEAGVNQIVVSHSGAYATEIAVLAEQTSEETPLYLVVDGEILYAVIGDQAYRLSDFGDASVTELPEIFTGDQTIVVEKIKIR